MGRDLFEALSGWIAEKVGVKALGENVMVVISVIILIVVFAGYLYFQLFD